MFQGRGRAGHIFSYIVHLHSKKKGQAGQFSTLPFWKHSAEHKQTSTSASPVLYQWIDVPTRRTCLHTPSP